jgi:leukotriene-A4 hydrolase
VLFSYALQLPASDLNIKTFTAVIWMSIPSFGKRALQVFASFTPRSILPRPSVFNQQEFHSMAIRPAPIAVAKEAAASIHAPRDPNTLSNYNAWRTRHTLADLEVDFDAKNLTGTIHLELEKLSKGDDKIVLDTR